MGVAPVCSPCTLHPLYWRLMIFMILYSIWAGIGDVVVVRWSVIPEGCYDYTQGLVSVDLNSRRATFLGGTTWREVNHALAKHNLAMPILGSISDQTIAGAIATGNEWCCDTLKLCGCYCI